MSETITSNDLPALQRKWGIDLNTNVIRSRAEQLAMDAQPTTFTTPNAAIPAFLSTYFDPETIRIAYQPMKASQVLGGEEQKGTWVIKTATFTLAESLGEVSTYGDWNNNGSANANFAFVSRQSYHYQVIQQYGEKEMAEVGLTRINYKNELDAAALLVLNKAQNATYLYGVSGQLTYGLLNDPSLPAPITPGTKAAGGTTWARGTPNENFADIQTLFAQLITQTNAVIDMDSPMTLAMAPILAVYLQNTNSFAVNTEQLIKRAFPNLKIVSVPEYATTGGNLIQLIARSIQGQATGFTGFTEKLRVHQLIPDLSSWKQKKSQGTWGAIIKQPRAFAQMLGV